jgi:hypothetical protein
LILAKSGCAWAKLLFSVTVKNHEGAKSDLLIEFFLMGVLIRASLCSFVLYLPHLPYVACGVQTIRDFSCFCFEEIPITWSLK